MKSTNYYNAFIEVAADCPARTAEEPAEKSEVKSVARLHYELLAGNPYVYTSDEVVFQTFALRRQIGPDKRQSEWNRFFSKGQPCLRSSPLTKRYGWGIHSNSEGRVAIYGVETEEYRKMLSDPQLQHIRAMRSKRAK